MANAYQRFIQALRSTPQSEPIPGTVPNSAGGYGFAVDDWTRLRRFLILGSEGGSFYAGERTLTRENASCVERCIALDPRRTVDEIVAISEGGLAPKNDPALLALALCASAGPEARALALAALPRVVRIGTHLFHFASYVDGLRGWGRGLRRAVADWYLRPSVEELSLQLVKYKQRDGWSHRDLLRLSHAHTDDPVRNLAFRYAVKGAEPDVERYPALIDAALQAERWPTDLPRLIRDHHLPRECVPTAELKRLDVWEALLEHMPLTALIRNLGKMTEIGLVKDLSQASQNVCERLASREALKRARVHPLTLLLALRTYQQGHGFRGSLAWRPVARVVDALDAAFYLAFEHVEPTRKSILIGLDVSGSMASSRIAGSTLTAREASCAMAMVTARSEPSFAVMAFTGQLVPFEIGARERLDDVCRKASALPFGATDCALPMQYAREHKLEVDAFYVYTDSETWCGSIHPVQALNAYRRESGRAARSAVVAFVANAFSIADPNDAGMLDFAGLDASLPTLLGEFTRGSL